ncbi:VWA domain-containing protein [Methanosarcinaceae archaeon]|nr:VWA domain-containing protein [Methanosarcinaceae archaeon]MBQ3620684.1 VWA domain-containing protein [Methanosarcinaceae archaeon]
MKKDLVELVFILDRSGSMSGLEKDTIGGFNSLIEKQKAEEGEAFVTTVLFDDCYEMLHDHVNIKDVSPITEKEYYPRGMTALLDAVGRTVNKIGERLASVPEEERPEKVIIVITTDGMENASTEFTLDVVKKMIEYRQKECSWTFMFLGANMDAAEEAGNIGIDRMYARTYTNNARGVGTVYSAMSESVTLMRRTSNYTSKKEQEEALKEALDKVE